MKRDLEARLAAEGVDVDPTTRGVSYGDGRVYVLPDSYDKTGTYDLNVICAVAPGHDIETFTNRVFTLCAGSGFEPSTIEFVYGSEPIAGRQMSAADYSVISVQNSNRFGDV